MHRHWIGIVGLAFLLVGLGGALLLAGLSPQTGLFGQFRSNGESIYFTGVGRSGAIPRVGGVGMMMSSGGCVTCHGSTGRGGRLPVMMAGVIRVPDIRYSTLTSPHEEPGEETPAWTEAQIARAIREGVEPSGETMNPYMPLWDMDDADMKDLIGYLKELKQR